MATAIRLAKAGHLVTVFEKNTYAGGKLSEMTLGKYRFDKGPSLLTMPQLIDELSVLAESNLSFKYTKLDTITHYFFEDGTRLEAKSDVKEFARELKLKLNEDEEHVLAHLKTSAFYYDTTADIFLKRSLHVLKNFFDLKTLKGILHSPRLNLFKNMHAQNAKRFKNKKTVQLFDRYATYNGSNPYKAPALLNIIPHLEFGFGAFIPKKGMHQISEHLVALALELGVSFKFDSPVEKIDLEGKKIKGLWSRAVFYPANYIVSDADMHVVYNKLLGPEFRPQKLLAQEKSSSAYVFFLGIKKEFKELGLHNILFSENYQEEFRCLFETDEPYSDPTIYINITSKYCPDDAPKNSENWFVMVNVPHNKSGEKIRYADTLRKQVFAKINRVLNTNIEDFIEEEAILDPYGIELQTSSVGGSLYGNSSNNKYAAFLRHANFNSRIKGLYFVGGSVHPGGGIPLCLMGANIVSNMISKN